MKKWLLLLSLSVFPASSLYALSYPPPVQEPPCVREEVLTVGAKVYMFHSGTHDVQSAIRIGDVLTVYHDYPPDPLAATKQTGVVKVISTIGNYYFLGHVIEGVVQPGSLAMKGTTACIITFQPKQK